MVRWKWKDGIAALLAVALLLLAEVLRFSEALSQNWESFEIICNALMLGIAIFFSARELSAGEGRPLPAHRVVWIEAVSLIAFPMNIDVFGHVIRLEQLPADLWGWHSLWIVCAILELLILTSLGNQLLTQVKALLAQLMGLLKWGRSIAAKLGSIISEIMDQSVALIKESNGKTLFTIIFGMFLWGRWLDTQLSGQDKRAMFADIGFWGRNLLFWTVYLLVMLLIWLFAPIGRKTREGIQKVEAKYVLAVVAIAVLFCVSALLLPFVWGAFNIILIMISLLIFIVKRAGKRDTEIFGDKNGPFGSGKRSPAKKTVRMKDLIVLLILLVVLPLGTILLLALFTPAGIELISGKASDVAAWLNFWNSILEITNGLLQLFSLS